jgi:hypothetical protein
MFCCFRYNRSSHSLLTQIVMDPVTSLSVLVLVQKRVRTSSANVVFDLFVGIFEDAVVRLACRAGTARRGFLQPS